MHHIVRHRLLPWAQLRISTDSRHCYRLHTHAEYSLGLVDAGQAQFVHGEHTEPLQAGDVVMIEPQVWHACNPPLGAPWSYRMLYLNADWLHRTLQLPALTFARRKWRDTAPRLALAALCAHLQQGHAAAFEAQLTAWLLQPRAVRPATLHPTVCTAGVATVAHPITQAIEQLHAAPQAPLSVAALADSVGLSVSHFIRTFKAHTGVTPATYRLNARLQGARELLTQGATLADAAASMGFADQAHLQRSFKAHHAMTPGQYAARQAPAPTR